MPFSRKILIISLSLLIIAVPVAYAATDIKTVITRVSDWFLNIILAIGVIMILVGAFFLTTSGGDPQKVQKGNKTIIWGAGGVAVALLAEAIIKLVEKLVN